MTTSTSMTTRTIRTTNNNNKFFFSAECRVLRRAEGALPVPAAGGGGRGPRPPPPHLHRPGPLLPPGPRLRGVLHPPRARHERDRQQAVLPLGGRDRQGEQSFNQSNNQSINQSINQSDISAVRLYLRLTSFTLYFLAVLSVHCKSVKVHLCEVIEYITSLKMNFNQYLCLCLYLYT